MRPWLELALPLMPVLALLLVPLSFLESGYSICLFKNLLGTECPGCGMLRAIACVLHGDFTRAFEHNRSVVIVFPLLAWTWLDWAAGGGKT